MTERIYYSDNYLRETDCTVVSAVKHENRTEILLDKTICYPECGGQPGDRGFLENWKILDTKKADDGDSIHILEKDCTLKEGDKVHLVLDWNHRYKYMVMHLCQHLISGLLFNVLHIGTVAVHLGEDYLTIETDRSSIEDSQVKTLMAQVEKAITEGHPVKYHEMSHSQAESLGMRRSVKVDGDVRVVEIEGLDMIACGGVHAASTSEIRLAYCYSQEQIRGHVRLFFRCGSDAITHLLADREILSLTAEKLTCSSEEVLRKLDSLITDCTANKLKLKMLEEKSALSEISAEIKDDVALFTTNLDLNAFVQVSKNLDNLALCAISGNKWLIILKGRFETVDFNSMRKSVLPLIDAKGGGRVPVFQGIGQRMDSDSVNSFMNAFRTMI